jgi:hypothetical protein
MSVQVHSNSTLDFSAANNSETPLFSHQVSEQVRSDFNACIEWEGGGGAVGLVLALYYTISWFWTGLVKHVLCT